MNIQKVVITAALAALCGLASAIVPAQRAASPAGCDLAAPAEAVEQVPEVISRKVTLDPALLERSSSNLDALFRHVRLIPHQRDGAVDGAVDGYRLEIKQGVSLLTTLGIEDGDIIHSINGEPFGAGEPVFGSYPSLNAENSFVISLTRRGRQHLLQYEIR